MRRVLKAVLVLCIAAGAAAQDLSMEGRPIVGELKPFLSDDDSLRAIRGRLRVCSYNVENFTDGIKDGRERKVANARRQAVMVGRYLDEIQPDIVVLQEVENDRALRLLNRYVKEPFPLGYVTVFENSQGDRDKLNLAVLSRVPLEGVRELDFGSMSGGGRPPRGVISFYVDLGMNHFLLVYGVHLKSNWGDGPRNRALRHNALKLVREDADGIRAKFPNVTWETLVLGDMNVDPDSPDFSEDPSLEPLKDWVDLWRGRPLEQRATLPTRRGDPAREFAPVTFDRVIVSPELRDPLWVALEPQALAKGVNTGDVYRTPGVDFTHVSDHYPIFVDISQRAR